MNCFIVVCVSMAVTYLTIRPIDCKEPKRPPNYKCDAVVFDQCCNRMLMISDRSFVFPTELPQMNTRCKEVKRLERCLKDYTTNCLKGDTKNVVSVVIYSVVKTNKNYCSSPARKRSFVSFGHCANAHRREMVKAMEDLNRDMRGVSLYKQNKKMIIPLLCCNYLKFRNRVSASIATCKDSEVQEINNVVDGYSRDGLSLVCGEYGEEGSDKCDRIIGLTPKWTKPLPNSTFVLPAVTLLTENI